MNEEKLEKLLKGQVIVIDNEVNLNDILNSREGRQIVSTLNRTINNSEGFIKWLINELETSIQFKQQHTVDFLRTLLNLLEIQHKALAKGAELLNIELQEEKCLSFTTFAVGGSDKG